MLNREHVKTSRLRCSSSITEERLGPPAYYINNSSRSENIVNYKQEVEGTYRN